MLLACDIYLESLDDAVEYPTLCRTALPTPNKVSSLISSAEVELLLQIICILYISSKKYYYFCVGKVK